MCIEMMQMMSLSEFLKLISMKFEMGSHWKGIGFIVWVLRVSALWAASSNTLSSVLNGLLFYMTDSI